MQIVRTRDELRDVLNGARAGGRRVAFVPTMGYLHEGHLRLVDRARQLGDIVVLSIFVNPLQFGPSEDLASYPRDFDRDARLAHARGVDFLFAPAVEEMYPNGRPLVTVTAPTLSDRLCGKYRPGHFEGVLTVVNKLFNIVRPDFAVFGRKDFQQVVLVRRMVEDLDMQVIIDALPTVREPDGLAMSSRNTYLSPDERQRALSIYRAITAGARVFRDGETSAAAILDAVRAVFAAEPDIVVQYIELVNPRTLDPVTTAGPEDVLAVAAFVGRTRLIDNMTLGDAGA